MTTITRGHLELAALAAGHTIGWGDETAQCTECGMRGWHKLSCSRRTDRAPQYPATRDAGGLVTVCQRPCRCGPDMCADSVACPRR